jgi:hypothetical protein
MASTVALVSYSDTVTAERPFGDVFRKVFLKPGETADQLRLGLCECSGRCGEQAWRAHCNRTRQPVIFIVSDEEAMTIEFTGTP